MKQKLYSKFIPVLSRLPDKLFQLLCLLSRNYGSFSAKAALAMILVDCKKFGMADELAQNGLADMLRMGDFSYENLACSLKDYSTSEGFGDTVAHLVDILIKSKTAQEDYAARDKLCLSSNVIHRKFLERLNSSTDCRGLEQKIYHLQSLWDICLPVPGRFDKDTSVSFLRSNQSQILEISEQMLSSIGKAIEACPRDRWRIYEFRGYTEITATILQGFGNVEKASALRQQGLEMEIKMKELDKA